MLEELIHVILPPIIAVIELVGIFVVTTGAILGFYHYIMNLVRRDHYSVKYELANSMATGLEFKMAAEILKTVLVRDLNELLILGSIILLRALLSFLIHFEMRETQRGEETAGE